MLWVKLALKDLFHNKKFTFFFLLNLILGLLGFVSLDAMKSSIEIEMSSRQKNILTADISFSGRRPLNTQEEKSIQKNLPDNSQRSEVIGLYSMASFKDRSRLVNVYAVDAHHPLYGSLILKNQGVISQNSTKSLLQQPEVWVYPEVLIQLNAQIGDWLQIGEKKFQITDLIEEDSGNVWSGFNLAPRVYIGMPYLDETKLLRKGSLATYISNFKLPPKNNPNILKENLDIAFEDPGIRIQTPETAHDIVSRMSRYMHDYLGLVALIALFLSALGSGYLFRSYLNERLKDTAILLFIGSKPRQAISLFSIQLFLLGSLAATFAVLFTALLLPAFAYLIKNFLPTGFIPTLTLKNIILAYGIGIFGSFLSCLPLFDKIFQIKPRLLLQENATFHLSFRKRTFFLFLPVLTFFFALALLQSRSWLLASLFMGGVIGGSFILMTLGWVIVKGLGQFTYKSRFLFKMTYLNLSRQLIGSLSAFLAIGLASLMMNVIPQIENSLRSDFESPDTKDIPSLFLFDIQPEQIPQLHQILNKRNLELNHITPLIRSRITKVNNQPFQKVLSDKFVETRERQWEKRLRNRAINLTYREKLTNSEEMIAGKEFSGVFDWEKNKMAEVSLSKDFAETLNLNIGDVLEFDIQGLPIAAQVVNIRKVKWTSFQPNFFVVMQKGVLEDAPQSLIATLSPLPNEVKYKLQNEIIQEHSNISIIDVTQVIDKILSILHEMGTAIHVMAYLALLAGLFVLYSISYQQAQLRQAEFNLLKILGTSFQDLKNMTLLEFGGLGFTAALFGCLLSLFLSFMISKVIFERSWVIDIFMLVISTLGITILSLIISYLAIRKTLSHKLALN